MVFLEHDIHVSNLPVSAKGLLGYDLMTIGFSLNDPSAYEIAGEEVKKYLKQGYEVHTSYPCNDESPGIVILLKRWDDANDK